MNCDDLSLAIIRISARARHYIYINTHPRRYGAARLRYARLTSTAPWPLKKRANVTRCCWITYNIRVVYIQRYRRKIGAKETKALSSGPISENRERVYIYRNPECPVDGAVRWWCAIAINHLDKIALSLSLELARAITRRG